MRARQAPHIKYADSGVNHIDMGEAKPTLRISLYLSNGLTEQLNHPQKKIILMVSRDRINNHLFRMGGGSMDVWMYVKQVFQVI